MLPKNPQTFERHQEVQEVTEQRNWQIRDKQKFDRHQGAWDFVRMGKLYILGCGQIVYDAEAQGVVYLL